MAGISPKVSINQGDLNWIQCEKCKGWEVVENSGIKITGKFSSKKLSGIKFTCRHCKADVKQVELENRINTLQDQLKKTDESIVRVESTLIEMGVKVELDEDQTKDHVTQCCINKLDIEDKISKASTKIEDLQSRALVLELRFEEIRQSWPTPSDQGQVSSASVKDDKTKKVQVKDSQEIELVVGTKSEDMVGSKKKVSFSEKYKGNDKETVILLGDSLARGVGCCLERDSHMFSSRAYPGARVENIEDKLKQLGSKPNSHVVVMAGTNNIKSDGSKILLDKYKSLIDEAEKMKFKKLSLVSVPSRTDLSNFQNSRRIGVNQSLSEICREKNVEFIELKDVTEYLSSDGLHLRFKGQDMVARQIFGHCKLHLN